MASVTFTQIYWDEKGLPHSVAFDDKYFCEDNGLLESRHVFCGGNRLSERFKALNPNETFAIGETGFGTGLNFLCAWQLFDEHAPQQSKLHFISLDQFPLSASDLIKALSIWPELKNYTDKLTAQYSQISQESPCIIFNNGRVKLTLIYDHVDRALAKIKKEDHKIDAWFMDGFGPAKNPDMWSEQVFEKMAVLSHRETTCATFTVAGHVRRGLRDAGFEVKKAKGVGRKRQMLEGMYL